jgi:hypothetical protein
MPASGSGRAMSWDFGLESPDLCLPRKNRWLFKIPDVSAEGANTLPPQKGSRPSLSFKEMEAQHLTETIYFPQKPEWKPVSLTLYEPTAKTMGGHPVWEWVKKCYRVTDASVLWTPSAEVMKERATLEMYNGCGDVLETWVFENAWPQAVEFGDLDMSSSDVVTCDLTIRYDRAYIQ